MNINVFISENFSGLSASANSLFNTEDSVTVKPEVFAGEYYRGLLNFISIVTDFHARPAFGFYTVILPDKACGNSAINELQNFADNESLISVRLTNSHSRMNSAVHEAPCSDRMNIMFIFGRITASIHSENDLRDRTEDFLKRLNIIAWHFNPFSDIRELSRIRADECLHKALESHSAIFSCRDTRSFLFHRCTIAAVLAEKIKTELSVFGRWQDKTGLSGKNALKRIIPDITGDTFILRNDRQQIITAYETIMNTPGIKEKVGFHPVTLGGTDPILYQDIVSHDHEYGDFSVYLRNHPKLAHSFTVAKAKAFAEYVTGRDNIDGEAALLSLSRGHFNATATLHVSESGIPAFLEFAGTAGILPRNGENDCITSGHKSSDDEAGHDISLQFDHECRYQDLLRNADYRIKTGIPDPSYLTGLTEKDLPEFTSLHSFFLIVTAIAERAGISEFRFSFSTPLNKDKQIKAGYGKMKIRDNTAGIGKDSAHSATGKSVMFSGITETERNVAFKPVRIVTKRCSFFNSCSAMDFSDFYELTATV